MSELTHPRDTYAFDGGEAAELAFLSALERGRLHHAWLLVGPEGVGKATFAYRAARRLLGAKPEERLGPLGAHPEDPVCRQIATARGRRQSLANGMYASPRVSGSLKMRVPS